MELEQVGQEGWRDLSPEHKRVLEFYGPGRRSASFMLALWESTWQLWTHRVRYQWETAISKLEGKEWPGPLRQLKREVARWKVRMAAYHAVLLGNPRASEKSIEKSVVHGLLLNPPGTFTPVPDFLFPLYLGNQIRVLEAAHAENRQYFRDQLVANTRRVRDRLMGGISLMTSLVLPLVVAVAGGYGVYMLTRGRK